ncbi:UDP-N-acetyl-D-glucosamine 6-dehydrogenase [Paenibacillus konkukensis]|uniref:UDP-N-acetyl-D-glucosamine 6-dehydrogenase n=1 Tax=Paenibacillus konkukensis TaxID=2020716 RepID=A0ABY4RY16_9BACL|nr:nucleotide sugar dehydrogenase [Paenibacillus konkukensis]UQZ86644.1 UDP-N-acetyl-D-glucosamine 6-dehydrogenase [Paenibacillus konkukensis]
MNQKRFHIAIVGLGYVGLPLAQLFLEKGHTVYGIDVDSSKIQKLQHRQSYLSDFSAKEIRRLFADGTFHVSESFDAVGQADAVIICVPTPLDQDSKPDLTYVKHAVRNIMPHLHKGHLVVLESSTYPGTTEEELQPLIESTGMVVGVDVHLAYSPERIDPGARRSPLHEIPKVLGGVSGQCTSYAKQIYESVFQNVVVVSSPRVAEFTKILENCQRLVNISFMNELAMMCEKMNINLWEAIDAASTKPYGFTPYYPGPGIGGHCIPVDPLYLLWKAKQYDVDLQFIEVAHKVNEFMPEYVVQRVTHSLAGKPLTECGVLVIGVTYKKDVNDLRESTAIPIIEKLMKLGIKVSFHDPYIQEIRVGGQPMKGSPLTKRNIEQQDCVLILTDHSGIPYDGVAAHANLVIDTRNAMKHVGDRDHIVTI